MQVKKWAVGALLVVLGIGTVAAEEGMWPLHGLPVSQWKAQGIEWNAEQLAAIKQSLVRVGSSSAWVSSRGLVMTNHHVAYSCIRDLSSPAEDLLARGFLARDEMSERRCPGWDARLLVSEEEVTATLQGLVGAERVRRSRELEANCSQATGLSCQIVELHRGAQVWLYRYQRWDDVRLVFAPEERAGYFGGDGDNFNFPRYALDVAFVRVYDKAGQPVRPKHHLKLAKEGVKEGDVVVSFGHPGTTERSRTVADVVAIRDHQYPIDLTVAQSQEASLKQFATNDAESERRANAQLFGVQNWLKAMRGEFRRLNEPRFLTRKRADEDELRQKVLRASDSDPQVKALLGAPGDPWQRIERLVQQRNDQAIARAGQSFGFRGWMPTALEVVALGYEGKRSVGERLENYSPARTPRLVTRLSAAVPWYRDMETARLTDQLQTSMELLGVEHPWLATALAGRSTRAAAEAIIAGSKLDDAAVRRDLISGGAAAIDASQDAAIILARKLYPLWRASEENLERNIVAALTREYDRIGQLKFKVLGASFAPDATGTLRATLGRVRGYDREGLPTAWMTSMGGLFERGAAYRGQRDYAIPASWTAARAQFDPDTPFNWVSTLDIIGGSSGSPIVDRNGHWVGLIFDNNIDALGAKFSYDDRRGRAVAVDARAIMTALETIYGAGHLSREIRATK
jgi:Peptidase S46